MPTYSYACKSCGHAFDIQQAFTDDALTTCPECAGSLRKIFGSVGVVFKGSGFYRTDSRDSGKSSSTAGSAKETSPANAASGQGSAEVKTASSTAASTSASAGSSTSSSGSSPSSTAAG